MILTTRDGIEFDAFEAGPATAEAGILLVHDWWGVLEYNHDWLRRLGDLGYKALLVDLYDGECAHNAAQAGEMMRAVDQDEADAKLLAGIEYLTGKGCRRIAALGWSFGGRQAMQAALLDPESVTAAVLFYCRMVTNPESLESLSGPVLAIYSTIESTFPEKMEKFDRAMAELGKRVENHTYDAGHGFANPDSERYDADAAADTWRVTTEFLDRVLR